MILELQECGKAIIAERNGFAIRAGESLYVRISYEIGVITADYDEKYIIMTDNNGNKEFLKIEGNSVLIPCAILAKFDEAYFEVVLHNGKTGKRSRYNSEGVVIVNREGIRTFIVKPQDLTKEVVQLQNAVLQLQNTVKTLQNDIRNNSKQIDDLRNGIDII